jgi:hypothetical protein
VVDGLPGDEIWLIIRRDDGEESLKYQFSNAPPDTSAERFARDCRVADTGPGHAFEDGKGIAVASRIIRFVAGPDGIII